jgi:uncharacterized Zn finger protein (UPF0148 family)
MKEDKESPGMKIFIQVAGTVLTAVILYFVGINTSGERAKSRENETEMSIAESKEKKTIPEPKESKTESNNLGNQTELSTDNKISSPRPIQGRDPAKIEAESKLRYSSEVKDASGNGIADVEIYCPNCTVKKVKTDKEGNFYLEGSFEKEAAFWQSTLILSKEGKSTKKHTINWREKSPQPIPF